MTSEVPWEVVVLVGNHLDPKALALASCVSKPWYASMSSHHLWKHFCATHYPSLSHLRSTAAPSLPYHRLYSLGYTSAKRRQRNPQKPNLQLQSLLFIITLTNSTGAVTLVKPGSALSLNPQGSFRFDFDVDTSHQKWLEFEVSNEVKVTWNVVLGDFESVFNVMDCHGKGSFVSGTDGWFSAELPQPGCCCSCAGGGTSGLVGDIRLGMREAVGGSGSGRMVVERVSVGVLSIVSWRYVCVEDGLRYLQHFLMPSTPL